LPITRRLLLQLWSVVHRKVPEATRCAASPQSLPLRALELAPDLGGAQQLRAANPS
jgi:hypothetical protein